MVAVDTNLFVNAISKGLADGQKLGSDYSNFVTGAVKGYDESLKEDLASQQIQIQKNEIEQIPVQNRLREAQATQVEANVSAYKADPQAYIDAQLAKQKEITAQADHATELRQQEADWTHVMQTGSSADKAQAIAGQQFTMLYGEKPHFYESAYNSAGNLDKVDRETVYRTDIEKKLLSTMLKQRPLDQYYLKSILLLLNRMSILAG